MAKKLEKFLLGSVLAANLVLGSPNTRVIVDESCNFYTGLNVEVIKGDILNKYNSNNLKIIGTKYTLEDLNKMSEFSVYNKSNKSNAVEKNSKISGLNGLILK